MQFIALLCLLVPLICCATLPNLGTDNSNAAIRWANVHAQVVETPGFPLSPPLSARAAAIFHTAMYDAWAHYDNKALPSMDYNLRKLNGDSEDVITAVSVAAWRTINSIYNGLPNQALVNSLADALLLDITGLTNPTEDNTNDPEGVGNYIAGKLMAFRDKDGANSLGDHPFSSVVAASGSTRYQDYTNYFPINKPCNTTITRPPGDCTTGGTLVSINKWEPLTTPEYKNGTGTPLTRGYATPHMANVKPFALSNGAEFRPQGPPIFGKPTDSSRRTYEDQHLEVLQYSSTLDDRQKMITQFWLPTPDLGNPPNIFIRFSINALVTDKSNLEDSIKLFFLVSNAAFDAGIAAWDAKRMYDSARPFTGIRCLKAGVPVQAWAGYYQGVQTIDGGAWLPYQDTTLVTPPFSEYVSGHSTFSMAAATAMKLFYNSDTFIGPNSITFEAGDSYFEPKITDTTNPSYRAGFTDVANRGYNTAGYVPASAITLEWDTWSDAAVEAGISRLYGGIHIHDGNIDGQELGRQVGEAVYEKAKSLFDGEQEDDNSSNTSNSSNDNSSDNSSSGNVVLMVSWVIALACLFSL